MRSADTDPAAERVQIELLRNASPARRATLALALSQTTIDLAKRAIKDAHPTDEPDELSVRFVGVVYGSALAERIRHALEARRLQRSS